MNRIGSPSDDTRRGPAGDWRDLDVAGVSFDATGTLFSCPDLGEIYSEVLTRHDRSLSSEVAGNAFREAWLEFECRSDPRTDRWAAHPGGARGWWSELIRRVCALAEVDEPSDFAVAELMHRFTRADAWSVYPEVRRVLQGLSKSGVPAVVTSNWDARLHELLSNLELEPHFVSVICSERIGAAKPNAAMFEAARRSLKAHAPQAGSRYVHVGDHRVNDVEGAEAAGFEGVLLDRKGNGDITGLTELKNWLEGPKRDHDR